MRARLVNEELYFQRGGNPLSSMGLGGFSFDTLRPGAILKSKKYFGLAERSGNITTYHSAKLRITPGQYLLVTDVRPGQVQGESNITFKKYRDLDLAKEERLVLKEKGLRYLQWYGVPSGFFSSISKKKFDYRLEIIEPGFSMNEGQGFVRGMDTHRALGIGNPFLRLKPGDILLPKKNVYVSETRHNFTSFPRGLKIWMTSYVLVHKAFFLANGELKVGYIQLWNADDVEKLATILPDIEIFWMRGTLKQFQNRFTIYEG